MERLTKPDTHTHSVPGATWMEDWDTPQPKDEMSDGTLVTCKVVDRAESDSATSVEYTTCATYPSCKSCTEREVCPISKFKKKK